MAQPRLYDSPAQRQAAYLKRKANALDAQLKEKGLPPLPAVSSTPGKKRWKALIQHAVWALQTAAAEMDDYSELRSEKWMCDGRGDEFRERIDQILAVKESAEELYE